MPTFAEICEDPAFADLPYRIETDGLGKIIMSPHWPRHSMWQKAVDRALEKHAPKGGLIMPECAVETADGTKTPDIVWIAAGSLPGRDFDEALTEAPEICVEVTSKWNSRKELMAKFALYFEAGARECWLCDEGCMEFFGPGLEVMERSQLAPKFPVRLKPLV